VERHALFTQPFRTFPEQKRRTDWDTVEVIDRNGRLSRLATRFEALSRRWDKCGEARYSEWIKPGEEIHVHGTAKTLVVDVVPVMRHDEHRYGGS
jgi:hypothetical protein